MTADIDLMNDPDQWTSELLPLVRGDEFGLLYCPLGLSAPEPVIYLANLFDAAAGTLAGAPQERYASLDAIISDGWQVD